MFKKRILVVGASGFVGRHLVGRLIAEGYDVVVAGRDVSRLRELFPSAIAVRCDLERYETYALGAVFSSVDVLINCAGVVTTDPKQAEAVHSEGARLLFGEARINAVPRIIQISALGADPDARTRFHLSKRSADKYLASFGNVDWAIVRPSLIIGRGGQSTELFATLSALPLPLRLGAGKWQVQPIAIEDLVDSILALVEAEGPIRRYVDAVGPNPMTTDDLTRAMRAWLGLPKTPFFSLPSWLLSFLSKMSPALGIGSFTPETLSMLRRGNVASSAGFTSITGITPMPIDVALAQTPASQADLSHARLQPLHLLMRLLLAFTWLAGGIVPLFFTPPHLSFKLLAAAGLYQSNALLAFICGVLLDILLGLAFLTGRGLRWAIPLSIATMIGYTAILTYAVPSLWSDPFGSLVKNGAVLGLTLAFWATRRIRG